MRDPVCGMTVKDQSWTSVWLDCTYRFCSAECKATFDANPGLYLSDSARGA